MQKRVPPSEDVGLRFGKQRGVPKRKIRKLMRELEMPPSPIELKYDEHLKHMRWKVIDPRAWTPIREELLARQGGKCAAKCGATIYLDFSELHHKRGRGMGGAKRCDCPDCTELLCKSELLQDGTTRKGCHQMIHDAGKLESRVSANG
jgi:hypothetical protein